MSPGTGHSRARYRGPLGATRREHVHYACACGALHSVEVVVSVDSQSDPLLARRMRDGDGSFNSTVCPDTRVRAHVEVPVVYHDPMHRLFALVLPEGARTRELRERAALLLRLADDTAHAVPPYVLDFAVAYGAAGLRRCVESATDRALSRRAASVSDRELTPAPAFEPAAPRPLSAPNGSGAVRQASESGAVRSASAPTNESGAVRSVTGAANESGAVRSLTGGAAGESGAVRAVVGAAAGESGAVRAVTGAAASESGAVRAVVGAAASESGAVRSFLRGPGSESGQVRSVPGSSTTESSVVAPLPTPPRSESSVMAPLPTPPATESSVMAPLPIPPASESSVVAPLPVPPATESGAATPVSTSAASESGDERSPGPPPAIWQAPSPPAFGSSAAPEPGSSPASEDQPPPWIGATAAPILPDSPAIGSDEPRSLLPEPPTRPISSPSLTEPQTPPVPSSSLSEPLLPEPPTRPMSSLSLSEPPLPEPPLEPSTAHQSPTRSRVPTSPLPAPPPSRESATQPQPATGSGAATPSASPSRPSAIEPSPVAAPLGPAPAAGTEGAPPLAELVDADPDGETTSPIRGLETVVTPPAAGAETQPDETWPYRRADADCGVGDDGLVHLSVRAAGRELAMLSSPDLGVRLQLHRMPSFPVVTIALGSAAALAGEADAGPPRWVALHIGHEPDAAVLRSLARSFEIELQALDIDAAADAPPVARARLAPPLADNAAAVLAGALDYLKGIPPERRSFSRALSAFEAADHDRLGTGSSHAAGLQEQVLDALESPAEVLRACALVKRFSQPTGEDWLIMTRSYPLPRWQAKRRAAVSRAVELGIWPGPVGAQIAVADGLARSRKNLVLVLQRHFAATLSRPTHGLDEAAVRDNWKALKAEARALGLPVSEWSQPRRPPIMSESEPVTSGTIGDPASTSHSDLLPALGTSQIIIAPSEEAAAAVADGLGAGDWTGLKGRPGRPATARRGDLAHLELAELLVRLRIRERRHAAAVELCRRGEIAAMEQVFRSVELMTRGEASRVLATAIQFGRGAEPNFLAGLKSRKAFVRQGAAFALAVTRGEAGVEAVCDLLLDEPTEMWREIARALGEAGTAAVMPLAARLGERTDQVRERAAWALAHVAARGARRPIETLAAGRDPVAAGVARRALELVEQASGDDLESRNEKMPRDQALNRAFSRRFLDTLRAERRAIAEAAARGAADTTSPPPVLLEASDLASPARDEDGEDAPDGDADDAGAAIGAEASGARGSDRAPS